MKKVSIIIVTFLLGVFVSGFLYSQVSNTQELAEMHRCNLSCYDGYVYCLKNAGNDSSACERCNQIQQSCLYSCKAEYERKMRIKNQNYNRNRY